MKKAVTPSFAIDSPLRLTIVQCFFLKSSVEVGTYLVSADDSSSASGLVVKCARLSTVR